MPIWTASQNQRKEIPNDPILQSLNGWLLGTGLVENVECIINTLCFTMGSEYIVYVGYHGTSLHISLRHREAWVNTELPSESLEHRDDLADPDCFVRAEIFLRRWREIAK